MAADPIGSNAMICLGPTDKYGKCSSKLGFVLASAMFLVISLVVGRQTPLHIFRNHHVLSCN